MTFIYFGTPQFSATILQQLVESGFRPEMVVTQPDQPVGRKQVLTPSPVKVLAQSLHIPVLTPQKLIELKNRLPETKSQLLITAAYGKIFKKWLLDWPTIGCLNVHASLLPKLRGASPVQSAILEGLHETGVTIMVMDEGMDTGPVLAKEVLKIEEEETTQTLSKKLAEQGADLLIKTLESLKDITSREELNTRATTQDHEQATYTKIITKEDGKIAWQNQNAIQIERMVRAYQGWPGVYATVGELLTTLGYRSKPTVDTSQRVEILKAGARDGKLEVLELKLAGKNPITWQQFATGYIDKNPRV